MRALARVLLFLALGGVPLDGAWARTAPKGPKAPVVVELFTAQGCASCRQANRLLARIADRPGVIALTWSVDYWDYLGWKDTFAQPEFAARQKAYVRHVGPADVYTPQVVVNGASQVSGDDSAAVEALIRRADLPKASRPRITFLRDGGIRLGRGHAHGRADVWLVRFDPREQTIAVSAGDNRGAGIIDRNVVRRLVRLGVWRGQPLSFPASAAKPAPGEESLSSVVIVQGVRGGPIIEAAAAPRPRH